MSDKKTPTYHLSALHVENVARIRAADLQFGEDDNLVLVTGENAQGKTSLLKALQSAIESKRKSVADPIHDGAERGEVRVELVDAENGKELHVRRRFLSSGSSTLKVTDQDGMQGNQATLNALLGDLRDPLELLSLKEAEQTRRILSMVDLGSFDLDKSDAELEALRSARRTENTILKQVQSDCERLAAETEGFDPDTAGTSAAVLSEYEAAAELESAARSAQISADAASTRAEEKAHRVQNLEDRIRDLQEQLQAAQIEAAQADTDRKEAVATAQEARAKVPDMDALAERKSKAEEADRMVAKCRGLEESRQLLKQQEAVADAAQKAIDGAIAAREAALAEAVFPVGGMGYDAERKILTLNGRPWSQASDGEKWTACIQFAMSSPSAVRLLYIRNGSLLDKKRMEHLRQMCIDNDYRALIERVGEEEGASVVHMVDGVAEQKKGE